MNILTFLSEKNTLINILKSRRSGYRWTRYQTLILTILTITILSGCDPDPVPPPSESLRIATINSFLLSPLMYCLGSPENLPDCLLQYDGVPEANATKLATDLLQSNPDVIVLNEVFDEDARSMLVTLLSGKYKHYIKRITDADFVLEIDFDDLEIESLKFNGEDSGLMLFSHFPFETLPNPIHRWNPAFLDATTSEVAFIRFDDYADNDQLAAKGVGLVRISHPDSTTIYTVAFTHMQADYPEKNAAYPGVRSKQFSDIQRIISNSLNTTNLTDDSHVFLLGDLNVHGERGVLTGGIPNGGEPEWTARFGSGFFSDSMTDVWASTTSPQDVGITNFGDKLENPDDDARLDFILTNRAQLEKHFCVQHITRAEVGYSDHLLVQAHYNISGPLCDPRRAWKQPPLNVFINDQIAPGNDLTNIKMRDGAQWFYFDLKNLVNDSGERRTVSVAVQPQNEFDPTTNAGVVYELYDPTDLSIPIKQFGKETTELGEILDVKPNVIGKVFNVPDQFYVKIFSPNPDWTGDYSLLVHPHECQSKEDRCILCANEQPRVTVQFKANELSGLDDKKWYLIDIVNVPDSGDPQHIKVFAGPYNHNIFSASLLEKSNPSIVLNSPLIPGGTATQKNFEGDLTGQQSMYLVIKRTDQTIGDTFKIGWDTNLTVLHGKFDASGVEIGPNVWKEQLICEDETNPELGSDEIHLLISIDNGPWKEINYHEFECNDGGVRDDIEKELGIRRYVDNIKVKLIEEDGLINPDDLGSVITIQGLPANEFSRIKQSKTLHIADGRYRVTYNLSRCF